jgi:hypothetical protein
MRGKRYDLEPFPHLARIGQSPHALKHFVRARWIAGGQLPATFLRPEPGQKIALL